MLIRPEQSKAEFKAGRRSKPYYLNMRTNETKWIKPKCFGTVVVGEISTSDYKKRKKKWYLRGNKFVINMDLTYPATKDKRREDSCVIIQRIGRAYLSRGFVRSLSHETWWEQTDAESGEPFWTNTKNGDARWEQPWTPRDSLARMREELKMKVNG
jgi:hypothetical protein